MLRAPNTKTIAPSAPAGAERCVCVPLSTGVVRLRRTPPAATVRRPLGAEMRRSLREAWKSVRGHTLRPRRDPGAAGIACVSFQAHAASHVSAPKGPRTVATGQRSAARGTKSRL